MTWFTFWSGQLEGGPFPALLLAIPVVLVLLAMLSCAVVLITYFDRKVSADFQARVGPSRCGPGGSFQGFADTVKLLMKQSRVELTQFEKSWAFLQAFLFFTTVAILPVGTAWLLLDSEGSVFLPFWSVLVLSLGNIFYGLGRRLSLERWLGSFRLSSQALSATPPALLCILAVAAKTGSFKWTNVVEAQGAMILSWNVVADPFLFLSFFVFLVSGLILLGIPPFDSGTASFEIRGGLAGASWGWRNAFSRFLLMYGSLFWMIIAAGLFLGGWKVPSFISENIGSGSGESFFEKALLEPLVVLFKSTVLMGFVVWIARVSPRGRIDQVTDFAWRVLTPLALACFLGSVWLTAVWRVGS